MVPLDVSNSEPKTIWQKPFDPILLQARIATCLEKKRLRDRELRYLQQVERLITAAAAIETKTFNPDSLNDLSQHPHKLGQLARVFQNMAREVDFPRTVFAATDPAIAGKH